MQYESAAGPVGTVSVEGPKRCEGGVSGDITAGIFLSYFNYSWKSGYCFTSVGYSDVL